MQHELLNTFRLLLEDLGSQIIESLGLALYADHAGKHTFPQGMPCQQEAGNPSIDLLCQLLGLVVRQIQIIVLPHELLDFVGREAQLVYAQAVGFLASRHTCQC